MAEKQIENAGSRRAFDSSFGFSFSIAIGLLLFIAGLIISLTLGGAGSIGLIFGIPLLMAGLIIPLFMMRDLFKTRDIQTPSTKGVQTTKTSDATLQLRCHGFQKVFELREEKLFLACQ